MKTISRFGLLFVGASALPAFAASGCGDDGVTTGDEENVVAGHDDPFVEVVLKGGCSVKNDQTGKSFKTEGTDGKCPTTVKDVLAVLEADSAGGSEIYVVSELGDRPAEDVGYRFVIAQKTSLKDAKNSDLFFSTLGSADGISQGFLEVMAFSPAKQAYNYYALAKGKWEFKGDGAQAELDPTTGEPAFECLGCHKAGAPIMKELQDGWSNWHSTWFTPTDPKSKDETFKALFDKKRRADDLEDRVIEGTRAHNKGLVERALEEEELAPLLKRMLCEVDTGNLIGVHSKSSNRFGEVSTFSSGLPSSYLLHQLFKTPSGGSGAQGGYDNVLGMTLSLSSVNVPADSYKKALTEAKQKIGEELGDAMFPWFGPEKGYADNDVVQQLFAKKIVDKDLLADVLMTDFTVPVFSEVRCELAETLPEKGKDADAVRKAWIENLEGSELRGAAGLKARLENTLDFDGHQATLEAFVQSCVARKTAAADAFATDMLKIVSQRRLEFTEHFEQVVESPFLLPTDELGSQPGALRLNGATCEIEPQTAQFLGESGEIGGSTGSDATTATGTSSNSTGEGGGTTTSSTSTGEGGGGGDTSSQASSTSGGASTCAHDECVSGAKLTADCSACAAAVCQADAFCCDSEWDETCVASAGSNPACDCN